MPLLDKKRVQLKRKQESFNEDDIANLNQKNSEQLAEIQYWKNKVLKLESELTQSNTDYQYLLEKYEESETFALKLINEASSQLGASSQLANEIIKSATASATTANKINFSILKDYSHEKYIQTVQVIPNTF